MQEGSAGGELDFDQLPSGAWVIARWRIKAPIPRVTPSGDTSFFGYAELGGQVLDIRDRRGNIRDVVPRPSDRSSRVPMLRTPPWLGPRSGRKAY